MVRELIVALLVALLVAAIIAFLRVSLGTGRRWFSRIKRTFRLRGRLFVREPLPPRELPGLYDEFVKIFGEEIAGLPVLRTILKKNPDAIWLVLEADPDGTETPGRAVGFFEVFPLTKRASAALQRGTKDGRTLTASDVCGPKHPGSNYYIASVGLLPKEAPGTSLSRAVVLQQLFEHMGALNVHRPLTVFARPATPDGVRLLKRHNFSKLHSDREDLEAVWSRNLRRRELRNSGPVT
jgi:hypothetical protein